MGSVPKVVVLIDGANGLENMANRNFKDCIQIVDFYHALEHAGLVIDALIGKDHPDYKSRLRRWAKRLLKDMGRELREAVMLGKKYISRSASSLTLDQGVGWAMIQ